MTSTSSETGLRPVNLRTDLGPLADLIELAFSDSMDSSGRAAVREMRTLSRIGPGLNILAGVNEITQGISLGFVWLANGKLVGNVSIYPATWPAELGSAWIIANVAVHPEHRGQGIARHLMEASMTLIHQKGGSTAVLQVEEQNWVARRLYERLGFTAERTWTYWRRASIGRVPLPLDNTPYITRRRRGEWWQEYELAQKVRPAALGGMGWLRPLHISQFRKPFWTAITDWFNLKSVEHLVIRSQDERQLLATMSIESSFAATNVQLTLMVEPEYQGLYDEALLNLAVRRYGDRQPVTIEHPSDETVTSSLLQRYHFRPQRHLVHMIWHP